MDRENSNSTPVDMPVIVSAGLFAVVVFLIFVFAIWGLTGLVHVLAET